MKKLFIGIIPLILGILLFSGAGLPETLAKHKKPARAVPEYIFAVRGTKKEEELLALYAPLMEIINKGAAGKFTIKVIGYSDFRPFKTGLSERHFHFLFANPAETIWAENFGYEIFAKKGDDEKYRGVIVLKKSSPIHEISELYHHVIAFATPSGLAATLMNRYFLHQNGVNIDEPGVIKYTGSHWLALSAVIEGKATAAATWWPAWVSFQKKEPEMASELEVRWTTPQLVNWGLVARDDVPDDVREQVKSSLLSLGSTPQGATFLKKLNTSKFESADAKTFEAVRQLILDYEAVFGRYFF